MAAQSDNFEKAHSLGGQAIERMRGAEVPATPENYCVWYSYVGETNPELKRSMDILTSNGRAFTEELSQQLHEEFFESLDGADRVLETSGQIEQAVENVVDLLQQADAGADSYGKALTDFSGKLEAGAEADLPALIARMVKQTQAMQEQNERLKDQLAGSSNEITQLREDLESVRTEAMTDALTKIGNRKYFDAKMREFADSCPAAGEEFCVLLLDIDHFKKFNDTYGHQLGDQVLRLVAQALKESVEGRQTPARYGGEEFAMLLPGTDYEQALAVAEKARVSVGSKKIVRRSTGEQIASITVSVGVARFRGGEPVSEPIKRADAALYAAKHAGRNQVMGEAAMPTASAAE